MSFKGLLTNEVKNAFEKAGYEKEYGNGKPQTENFFIPEWDWGRRRGMQRKQTHF